MELLVREKPFKHAVVASVLPADVATRLVDLFETFEWERRTDVFYRFDVPSNAGARELVLELLPRHLRVWDAVPALQEALRCSVDPAARLEIHRYTAGCGIGPHTDGGLPEMRCVLNLNRGWQMQEGGVWILSAESSLKDPVYLPSINNTGFAFETGARSYHALSALNDGVAYGLTIRLSKACS